MSEGIRAARIAARAARQRLTGTFGRVQERLSPDSLRDEALDSMKQQVREAAQAGIGWARANPGIVAAFASAIGLYLVHRLRPRGDAATGGAATRLNEQPAVDPPQQGTEL